MASEGRIRIKICGITSVQDGVDAAAAGADAIGLNFYARSPRVVEIAHANGIAAALPPFVTRVGLFVDPEPELVRRVIDGVALDVLQFHGDEPAEFCRSFGRSYIKAVRMHETQDPVQREAEYADAAGLLLDTYEAGRAGGTGQAFDWGRIPATLQKPIILAGGLTPRNVAAAIHAVRPYAVDVSGGVESEAGVKDVSLMRAFVSAARDALRAA